MSCPSCNPTNLNLLTRCVRTGDITITRGGGYRFRISREEAVRVQIALQSDEPKVDVICVVWKFHPDTGMRCCTPEGHVHVWTPERREFRALEAVLASGIEMRLSAA